MNTEIAVILRELAILYELKGVRFKPRAFERAADAIALYPVPLDRVYEDGGIQALEDIDGVGPGIAERIEEYLQTGHIKEYERMKKVMPVDIAGLTAIEGVGPKTLKLLYTKLGIRTVPQLEKAARAGKLAKVKGIGPKREARILQQLGYLKQSGGRRMAASVWPLVRAIADKLEAVPGVKTLEPVGSLRRMQETVGDLDFVAATDDAERLLETFVGLPQVTSVYSHSEHKALVHLAAGMDADLWVVPAESWGAALIAWTGDKAHNIRLRTLAHKKGYVLDEFGLFKEDRMVAGRTEAEVYKKLGMEFIPPEIRTDSGEIEAALKRKLPKLVGYGDVKGDLQVQTDWTDGEASILEMAKAAKAAGLEYIAITDHTKSLPVAGGLDEKRIRKQWTEIDRVQKLVPGVKILKGTECDILKDGSLDLDDRTLAELDVVGMSVHSHFTLSEKDQTARIVRAVGHPHGDILFHPTGRLIGRRAPYKVNMLAVISAAKKARTVLEADADPNRLDLNDQHIRLALAAGVKISVDTDAHHPDHFAFLRWGIGQARRGWATAADVVNTRSWRDVLKLFA